MATSTSASVAFQNNLMALRANMFNFALMLTSNRDDAADLVQDTMLKVLDNSEKYTEGTNFKGWVFTVMRNLFINSYRRASRAATVVDQTEDLYLLNVSQESRLESPEEALSTGEISDALRRMDSKFSRPFEMHVAGYKYDEIAEELGLPLGTVKSRIFTARQELQTRFADYR